MKRLLMMSFLSVIVTSVFALKKDPVYRDARKNGAMARMQLHIVDDLGCNVSNAAVSVFMGMNFRPQGYYLKGMTDANGKYVAEGKTCGDEIEIDVVKQGHYPSSKRLCYAVMGSEHEVKNGKWQPFGKEETIVLRRMVNPVNLIVFDKVIDVVRTNAWLGFDMESMDFIKPIGGGLRADFEIMTNWDGLPAWESKYCNAEIRFATDKTGGYYVDNVTESKFPYAYIAIADSPFGEKCVRIVDRNGDPRSTKVPFKKDASLVIRTRIDVDEHGKLTTANYGCIRRFEIGPSRRGVTLLRLSYVFNPIPNDTNLEPK